MLFRQSSNLEIKVGVVEPGSGCQELGVGLAETG